MKGKNVLVTGASRGIGRGVAEYLLKQGANVILVARNEEKLCEVASRYPDTAYVYPCDLQKTEEIENIYKFCKEKGLKLHGLLHAAGMAVDCPIKSLDMSEAERIFKINYFAYVALTKYFIKRNYSEDGASAIVMSSMSAFLCDKAMSQYAASKNALNAYTEVLAREGEKRKIRANAIAPATVATEMLEIPRGIIEDFDQIVKSKQSYGVIPAEQIAYLVEFLLSDRSAYITGAVIPVSAGWF
jgi:NAD(P)-dependent dehydrogenase (short-subunit alcohol dehydrogenase family)